MEALIDSGNLHILAASRVSTSEKLCHASAKDKAANKRRSNN